jgi:hypothetical protein
MAMRRFERDGRWVEVGPLRRTTWRGQLCYEVDGRGDIDLYLGSVAPLYVTERADDWTIGYQPADSDFAEYAQSRAACGMWEQNHADV